MKTQLILARAIGYHCAALFVNQQVVVSESNSMTVADVVDSARKLSGALGVSLIECEVEVPAEMDGNWQWSDMLERLPPLQEQIARQELVIYCWSEGGVHPATVDGPGDAWDELCFDAQAPQAGTPYFMLAPVHRAQGELTDVVREKVLEDFRHWLNNRRQHEVSDVFQETVAKVASLISLSPVLVEPEQLVEQVAMSILGNQRDLAPGVNWRCDRQWRVNDVREHVRRALETAGILPAAQTSESNAAEVGDLDL